MSSETTELTFVRCPSCRSLVPATATRCRICNNPLDAGAKADDSDSGKSAGRIRQKTMTASAEDLASALGSATGSSASAAGSPPPFDSHGDIDSEVDPLGAYLQELEEAEEMGLGDASKPFQSASPQGSDDDSADDLDAFDLDIFDQLDEELGAAPQQPAPVEAAAVSRHAAGSAESARAAAPAAPSARSGDAPRRPTGIPQPAKSGGLNGQARSDQRRVSDVSSDPQAKRDQPQRPTAAAGRSEERVAVPAGPRTAKAQAGRLLGWLVSYENADGRAIELREGRFFITSNSIKENDLVIEDPSISTPHALMSVALQGGVKVQDLMSESGTYLRSIDEDSYHREEASVELKHGDWIRLGEVEFLVALVPQVRDRN